MKILLIGITSLLGTLTIMCSQNADSSGRTNNAMNKGVPAVPSARSVDYTADESSYDQPAKDNEKPVSVDRKLIKTGDFRFPTNKVKETETWVKELIKEYDGYIANESEQNYDYRQNTNISARIPVSKFDDFTTALFDKVKHFDTKDISVNDVTEEYLDVEARLKTKKALEARYVQLLSRANAVKDVIEVERELTKLRGEIESVEGRLNYLKNQTSFSTANISFYTERSRPTVGFFNQLGQAFKSGWSGLLNFMVGLVTIWPFILIFGLFIWWLIRLLRRSGSGKINKRQHVEEE